MLARLATGCLPLPRSSPAYMALRLTHENFEHAHQAWRSRYMSGGKSLAERPKRIAAASTSHGRARPW